MTFPEAPSTTLRRSRWVLASLAVAAGFLTASSASGARIDFESIPFGRVYGAPLHNPHEVVLVEDGIAMSVTELFFLGQPVDFDSAVVGGRHANVFPTTPLALNRIGVEFDFTNVDVDPSEVSFEYRNLGGSTNFALNGGPILEFDSLALLPTATGALAPGVAALVVGDEVGGLVTLYGDVNILHIGGEELYIDNVEAIPEPATLFLLAMGGALWRGGSRRSSIRRPKRFPHLATREG